MSKLIIEGGCRLKGEVGVSGSKNSCLPIMAATILTTGKCVIKNCPRISDADNMLKILEHTGAKVTRQGSTVTVDCSTSTGCETPKRFAREIRSSIFLLGPAAARFRRARFTYPGGCEIGLRPIDLHLQGLRALNIDIVEERGEILCTAGDVRGADVTLDYPSVGATENIMMAAVLAKGETHIRNAAREPEIGELAAVLNLMGAKVQGAGSSVIAIEGVENLGGMEYTIESDRIVAGTYMIGAAMTRGDVFVRGARADKLNTLIAKLAGAGAEVTPEETGIRVRADKRLYQFDMVETAPYPGFPTDLQALICAAAATAGGTSVVLENVFENRFKHINELNRMGASIAVKNNVAIIRGVDRLFGAEVRSSDLRAGAALTLAGLNAMGRTVVDNAQIIDRGYEGLDTALTSLGANITRTDD